MVVEDHRKVRLIIYWFFHMSIIVFFKLFKKKNTVHYSVLVLVVLRVTDGLGDHCGSSKGD